ncbi:hypothetical protein [Hubei diptera virus 17]|uniref:hypothetical protein n=1 Tax=Hubei diptera virus 17 TaxID=1922878 RepID=UPI00090B3483|nr:hypothetical protein [Hubei diptera virus 17]APG78259.1 hypothetical protein [Hubei diptera virus 17]
MSNAQQEMFAQFQAFMASKDAAGTSHPVPSTSAHRNNRSWGKKGKSGGGMPRTNVKANLPPVDTSASFPAPSGKYLAKTASVEKNDPLYAEAYFPAPADEFRQCADYQDIFTGCQGFPLLASEIYSRLKSLSPSFTKTVPKCAVDYYLAVMLYARLLLLHRENGGDLSYAESDFVELIMSGKGIATGGYTIPKSFALYLAGFGNTSLPNGRDLTWRMSKPTLASAQIEIAGRALTIRGYFGDIVSNILRYSIYPSLGVFAQRIVQDLARTESNQAPVRWDLPVSFRLPGHPITDSCLGCESARHMSNEQVATLYDAGVTIDDFGSNNAELHVHVGLLNAVHQKLMGIPILQTKTLPVSTIGSQGQIPYQQVVELHTPGLKNAVFSGNSILKIASSSGYLGSSYLYRIKNENAPSILRNYLPLHYSNTIPADIRAAMMTAFDASDNTLRYKRFEVVPYSASQRLEQIVLKDGQAA